MAEHAEKVPPLTTAVQVATEIAQFLSQDLDDHDLALLACWIEEYGDHRAERQREADATMLWNGAPEAYASRLLAQGLREAPLTSEGA